MPPPTSRSLRPAAAARPPAPDRPEPAVLLDARSGGPDVLVLKLLVGRRAVEYALPMSPGDRAMLGDLLVLGPTRRLPRLLTDLT